MIEPHRDVAALSGLEAAAGEDAQQLARTTTRREDLMTAQTMLDQRPALVEMAG
ncbi:MAG: hypothetical protein WKF96_20285 [Solirubrobacteraceae bacterium]